jgi:precorrin-6B methylase 2
MLDAGVIWSRPVQWSLWWIGRLVAWWLLWQAGLRLWRKIRPRARPAWLAWDPTRYLRQFFWPPAALVERLSITPGMHVVEVNPGTSRLTFELARAVGPTGQVIAVDERIDVVERLQTAVLEEGLSRVAVQQVTLAALPAAGMADLVILTTTFGGTVDKHALLAEAYRLLRPGGALAVTELLVDPDYSLASTVVTHLVLAGFGIEREFGSFADYTIIGRKAASGRG